MLTIDELDSEVVIEGEAGEGDGGSLKHEVRVEDLRAVVRELIAEELDRYLRTEARD